MLLALLVAQRVSQLPGYRGSFTAVCFRILTLFFLLHCGFFGVRLHCEFVLSGHSCQRVLRRFDSKRLNRKHCAMFKTAQFLLILRVLYAFGTRTLKIGVSLGHFCNPPDARLPIPCCIIVARFADVASALPADSF